MSRPRNGQKSNTELDHKNRVGIGLHKFSGLSLLTVQLLDSQEALCSIELIISWHVLTNTLRTAEQLLHPAD
jgi:hypothetical protein